MEPRQALQNLDNLAAQFNGNRETHALLQQSVRVLHTVIDTNEKLVKAAELQAAKDAESPPDEPPPEDPPWADEPDE